MADSNGGGGAAPWLAFLAGIVLAGAIVAFFTMASPRRDTAQLEIRVPNVEAPKITPPDVNPPKINPPDVNPAQPAQ